MKLFSIKLAVSQGCPSVVPKLNIHSGSPFPTLYLHRTLMVCVETMFSDSWLLIPWQLTTNERLLGSTIAVMLEVVIQPPSGLTMVRDVTFFSVLSPTIHHISALGLDAAVVHVKGTGSPTRASDGPVTTTCAGETAGRPLI